MPHTHLPYRHVDYRDGRLVSSIKCLTCGQTLPNASGPLVEEVRREIAARRARREADLDVTAGLWHAEFAANAPERERAAAAHEARERTGG